MEGKTESLHSQVETLEKQVNNLLEHIDDLDNRGDVKVVNIVEMSRSEM